MPPYSDTNKYKIRTAELRCVCSDMARKTRDFMLRLARQQPSGQFYETVVVVWLTLSVASVVLAAATWASLSRQLNAANQAVAIRLEADSIYELLLEAESSQRGFAITRNPRLLDSFQATATNLPVRFQHLASLAESDPALLARVKNFCDRAQARLNRQEQAVSIAQKRGSAAASAMAAGGDADDTMAGLRHDVEVLGATPTALVFDQGARARAQLTRASLTSLVAGVLGLGAGLFAFVLSRLTVKHQERERELIEARVQADRRSEEKTVFLANMSHEIRTPMNAILGFGELLENDLLNDKQRSYLQSIRRSASSLLQLINDMLDMSKIEAGVLELHPEPTDPREICQFIQTMFSEPAARKNLQLSWKVAENLPRSLLLDRIRLRQILVNLIGNAVKFTDHGSIKITIRHANKPYSKSLSLLIDVEDSGVGIPPDRLEAIFNPFVQAGAHPEKERQGTGLGLSIVKRLTEMMGGSVTVTSQLSHGSLFRLQFPSVSISDSLPLPDPLIKTVATNFNWLRAATVLGVDDNETNRHLLQAMLSGSHHRLLLASNGQQAIEMAQQARPDVILLDVRMPGMDGRQVLQILREIPALELTPVIAVTASTLVSEENDLKIQFDGYLQKPFSRQRLFEELARFLPRIRHASAMDFSIVPIPEPLASTSNPSQDEKKTPEKKSDFLRTLTHDLKSSLAGVVMSGELLFEQDACSHDEESRRLVTEILEPSRRLLISVKDFSTCVTAEIEATNSDPSSANGAERKERLALSFGEFKAQCSQVQANAQELCRRIARRAEGRPVQLAENIVRSCTELNDLLEKLTVHNNNTRISKPGGSDLSDMTARTIRRYRRGARPKRLKLLTSTHSSYGLSGY
jgi:signal transduction histidine kinase